ncbi:MAG: 3-deoxy-manno-octulosonate cytidylyltransferase, partial [Thermodesulfobacteriota bacterium]
MKVACVIPARYASQRFPGKVLAKLAGRPLIQWVYNQACKARKVDRVIVATDDKRVEDCVRDFGGMAVITSPDHNSGTDRVAEVAQGLSDSLIVNVQGDEPLLPPEAIDQAIELLVNEPAAKMATLATPIIEDQDLTNPNVVKVVVDEKGNALSFFRAAIPSPRSQPFRQDTRRTPGTGRLTLTGHAASAVQSAVSTPPSPFYRHV